MRIEIKVPSAGESVTEAVVASIIKESGSYIEKEGEVLELETDKVNQVIYAPEKGVLTLSVKVGDRVKVDQVIGTIETEGKGESVSPPSKKEGTSSLPPPSKKEDRSPPSPPLEDGGARRSKESFIASIEKEKQLLPKNVEFEEKKPSTQPQLREETGQTRKKMSTLRRTIAKRLVEVKNQTAMLSTFNEVDMSAVIDIRAREKEPFLKKHGVKLGFMSFFVKACVAALKELPDLNAFIDGDDIVSNHFYHIGISISTDKGLMVPVIKNCDQLTFAKVELAIQDFAEKARSGAIRIDDLQGGSFTITNGGVFGSMLSTPILNPPQSAILGMHNIIKRAVVVDDQIVIRPMMYLALSYDHRIVDGKEAITFLVKVKELLEKPERLLLDF